MHYPWWYVPGLTSPMVIAAIAVVHVLVAHYAVGGGIFLAAETAHAYRHDDREYLAYLKQHAQFFILLTVVFGAITGVGIWWTIGLASPLSTEVLIRTFVFGWAWEYVFFVVEIVAAFVFYYAWGRLPPRTHVTIGWIYAAAAWISLFLITGITAFMLHPGHWVENPGFWIGFFNPQLAPQVVARTGGALLLTSLYVYLHAAIVIRDNTRLKRLIEQRSTRPALLGAILITVGGALWYYFLPDSARAALYSAGVLNVLMALIFAATAIIFVLLYLGPYRNPGWLHSPGFAAALLAFAVIAFTTGEFIREAVRKPYIVYRVVYGNQVLAKDDIVRQSRTQGFLATSRWARAYTLQHYPQVIAGDHVNAAALKQLDRAARVDLGGVIFQYHCNDCHAAASGYSAVGPLVQGWSPEMIRDLVLNMDQVRFVMPPWCGTPEEADVLTEYLASIAPARPTGLDPTNQPIAARNVSAGGDALAVAHSNASRLTAAAELPGATEARAAMASPEVASSPVAVASPLAAEEPAR